MKKIILFLMCTLAILGMTQAQVEALPNGMQNYGLWPVGHTLWEDHSWDRGKEGRRAGGCGQHVRHGFAPGVFRSSRQSHGYRMQSIIYSYTVTSYLEYLKCSTPGLLPQMSLLIYMKMGRYSFVFCELFV